MAEMTFRPDLRDRPEAYLGDVYQECFTETRRAYLNIGSPPTSYEDVILEIMMLEQIESADGGDGGEEMEE
ncbi:15199_t:CDS:2 [Funneliformis geosporum]|uniref:15199_t:CDS:1 n=1 Tax=Funneliformis geosporum TaxID=1117311 RepID=A0A9W4SL67_9GLOM|nr:15199_t:CDS:2 [Funneliformis geosporum]